jgi:L-rhamnose mutarotase
MYTTGRRTTLRAGREGDYTHIHATIPSEIDVALRASGVIDWHIWRDGSQLFHSIITTHGYESLREHVSELGPINPEWDARISDLLESEPGSDVMLPLVWSMNQTTSVD